MKKIDLHIHTVNTVSDRPFEFSLDTFKRYVSEARLDAIAVTNHNMFDWPQFSLLQSELACTIFPGIEIDLQTGHLLLISSGNDLGDFDAKCKKVTAEIPTENGFISTQKLMEIFGDLSQYLLIPHYRKSPPVAGVEFSDLLPFFSAGEVDSPKKFVRELKIGRELCPVLFSDSRMETGLQKLPTRQTFIDCGELTLAAIKACLRSGDKVFLSNQEGNKLFQVFNNGFHISTGLNVIYGARSSGKTVTLEKMADSLGKVKYIKQFELVQASDKEDEERFNADVQKRRNGFVEEYLSDFRRLLGSISAVDIDADDKAVAKYVDTLLRSAREAHMNDSFSRVRLFDETPFSTSELKELKDLIGSVINLIENKDYRAVIDSYIQIQALRSLAMDLIPRLWDKTTEEKSIKFVNAIIRDVQDKLQIHTAVTRVQTTDLYEKALNLKRVERFNAIVTGLRSPKTIFRESVQGFQIIAEKGPYTSASELNEMVRAQTAFKAALRSYENPYAYLMALKGIDKIQEAELHRLFVKITYRILNEDGADVSGGERSEFRLLQAIKDAQQFDVLLIDEPESSFDNGFLNRNVNGLIRAISAEMPVVVVTHNNSVGASISPDYLIYAEKEVDGVGVQYRLYSGYPTDKKLKCVDGREVNTYDVFLNSLEAGVGAYTSRRGTYEAVKD